MGDAALDAYGVPLPDETLMVAKASYAVLLGAIGGLDHVLQTPIQGGMMAIDVAYTTAGHVVIEHPYSYDNHQKISVGFTAAPIFVVVGICFGEAIAMSKRSPEKLFVLLDMYEIICELQTDGLSRKDYEKNKELVANEIIKRLENKLFSGLQDSIVLKEVGSPKTHRRFLARNDGTYGPMPRGKPKGLLAMSFNTTSIDDSYCVGDNCFPGQGVIDVAFSGIMCAHRVAADIGTFKFY
ncbi:hypothetical protein ABZP36_004956 [Zizania latifolia]